MGMSLDSPCNATAECSSAWFKCVFVVEDAESSIIGLIAMVQLFPTGPVHETIGMVVVEERHQSPMQPSHD